MLVIPNTSNKLNIFDPTTFPIAIFSLSFLIATIDVTSSGKEVPSATILDPIIYLAILNFFANCTLLFTTKSPPNFNNILPIMI